MDPITAQGWWVLSSAIAGGILTIAGGYLFHRSRDRNLERDELRRRKVEIVHSLLGSRYVLSEDYEASSEEVKAFNTAIALLPVYFSKDREVIGAYERFFTRGRGDSELIDLLASAIKASDINVSASNLTRVYYVRSGRKQRSEARHGGATAPTDNI